MTVTWFMFSASTCHWGIPYKEKVDMFVVQNNTSDTLVWLDCVYLDPLQDLTMSDLKWSIIIPPNEQCHSTYLGMNNEDKNLRQYFSTIRYGYCTEIFFSLDTVKKYGWEDVLKKNRVYQRYDLCYDDVAPIQASMEGYDYNLDWELWFSVPPTDCMKDVKMWPPYGHYEIIGQ